MKSSPLSEHKGLKLAPAILLEYLSESPFTLPDERVVLHVNQQFVLASLCCVGELIFTLPEYALEDSEHFSFEVPLDKPMALLL